MTGAGGQGLGSFLGGTFRRPTSPDSALRIVSPADLRDVVAEHPVRAADVDDAIDAAREAWRAWRKLERNARAAHLRRYAERVAARKESIATLIAREVGKPLWEARTEVDAMIAKVDLSIREAARFTAGFDLTDLPGAARARAHGVVAVIGPFNFPGHIPNGQLVPALLEGNTVVVKPSERAPTVAEAIASCMEEAALPPGVFNLVQGGGEVAQRLVAHEGIDAILFTGSTAVGKTILERTAGEPGKLVVLELGGKNAAIVLDDADVERAAREIAFAAYVTAGQRCTATSRVYVARARADELVDRLRRAAESAVVGYPLAERVFLGPMIDAPARARCLAAQRRGEAAGVQAIVGGREVAPAGHEGFYVAPGLHVAAHSGVVVPGYTDVELFGPDVVVYPVDDADEAVVRANESRYGLSAAVFTGSRERFERIAAELAAGVVHHDLGTAGASGRLPFGGVRDSGNHRSLGILAGATTTYLQALRYAPSASDLPSWPGLFDEP